MMRLLEVSRYKESFADHKPSFVEEQGGPDPRCRVQKTVGRVGWTLLS